MNLVLRAGILEAVHQGKTIRAGALEPEIVPSVIEKGSGRRGKLYVRCCT